MALAFVTGATGFIGSRVTRILLEKGYQVRLLVRPGADTRLIAGLPVEQVSGDLRDPRSLENLLAGCEQLYHVGALYTYWTRNPAEIYATNVEGTRNILTEAERAGVQRIVYTSSVATLGRRKDGLPADETTPSQLEEMIGDYKRSKFLAEEVAKGFAARGLPVIIVNPSTPVGTGDIKPTPTGRIVLDFITGRMPAYVDTGLNIVDVDDVAVGHWLAAERGQPGERYILGNQNLTLAQIFQILSDITGRPAPRHKIPHSAALLFAAIDTTWARFLPSHVPRATFDTVRLSKKPMYFCSERAVHELGFPQTDVREALAKSVRWFQTNFA